MLNFNICSLCFNQKLYFRSNPLRYFIKIVLKTKQFRLITPNRFSSLVPTPEKAMRAIRTWKGNADSGAVTDRIWEAPTGSETLVGMLRFPWGTAGGMGFWGRRGPRLLFFLCFLVSAGGLVFFLGFLCCWCWTLRELSPLKKLSFGMNKWIFSNSDYVGKNLTATKKNTCYLLIFYIIPKIYCLPKTRYNNK